jgi:asparagine synthase (glutamine-hydrolysing)
MKGFADFVIVFNSSAPIVSRGFGQKWRPLGNGNVHWQAFTTNSGTQFPTISPISEKKIGGWNVWLLGEFYGYREHRYEGSLGTIFDFFCSDLLDGQASPESLNGHFLIFAWNQQTDQWHVWTNRMGTMHAYYATDGSRAALGTFFPAVTQVASRRELDWEGLTGFFTFGFFPQDRTYFKDTRILRPATHMVFDKSGRLLHQSRYWDWKYEPDEKRSFDDSVSEFGKTLNDILIDLTRNGRIAVPISGGLDSRTVAAIITHKTPNSVGNGSKDMEIWGDIQPRLWAYSYGYTDYSSESYIGSRVGSTRGIPFKRLTIPAYLFDRLDSVLASVEGFQEVTSTRQAAIVDVIASQADYLLAAHWGDVWMDDMGLSDLDQRDLKNDTILDHALYKVKKKGSEWLLEHLCQPRLGGEKAEVLLRDLVNEELNRVKHIDEPDFRVKAFKTEQWSFRWTSASLRMFQPGAFPRLPFYDNRMVDFSCTLPTRFVGGRRLQIEYLKRYHPDIARITWEVSDSSLFYYQYYDTWLLPKRAWKKFWRVVSGRRHIGRNWEVQFLNSKGKSGLHEWLLRQGLKIHEFISPRLIKSLIDELFIQPTAANGYALSQLLTFSSWLERYS